MTYLNRFHKESVERCLRKVAESKSLQMNCEEEVRKIKEMHKQIAQRYPKEAKLISTYVTYPGGRFSVKR